VQGFGGGMIFASVFSTIGDIFPPAERGKYMGMFTGTFSLASVLGPTFGGFLTDHGGWRWVFYVNVPFSLIAIPAIWKNLPSRKGVRRPKIDFLGAGLLSCFSVLFLLALVWAGSEYAWRSPQIIGLISTALVFLGLFVVQESRHPEAMVPLHLFRNRAFVVSNLIVFTLGIGMFGALQYLSLFVQTALGASATASGVITTPQSFGMLGASIIGGQIISRSGRYRIQTITGSIIILSAMLFLRTLDVDVVRWHISAWMVVLGVGFGLVMPTMSLAVQNAVPYQYLGVASSSSQFFRQIGSVFGVAVFGALLASSYHSAFSDNLSADTKAALGPQTVEQFDDPTLILNKREYAIVQKKVLALDGGPQLLKETVATQKESVAIAVRLIFTGATTVAAICIGMAFLMKEVPLRRGFGHTGEGEGPPAAAPPDQVQVAAPGAAAADSPAGREGVPGG
jgi:EmrB/QacA subfamily drug resistance transporter